MPLKDIAQAAMEKNPLEVKNAVEAELSQRVFDAIQTKMTSAYAAEEADDTEVEVAEIEVAEEAAEIEEADDSECVAEMQKLYASKCSKNEMYNKVSEKYGCSKSKFEALYAQYCNS